jgi:ABC-type branched-subunit amino acid transport system ATPase component
LRDPGPPVYIAPYRSRWYREPDYFRKFFNDSMVNGSAAAMRCGLEFFGADRIARMEEVLAIFPALRSELNPYVGTMSGGERKMTAIAQALMLSPRVLVLDEPTAGLSAVLTESVLADQVRALADRGHAVLLVEQKAQAALRLAHTASVLVRGQVVMSAPAAEVLASREMAEVFLGGRGRRQK